MFSPFSNLWFAVTYNAVLRTSSTNTVDFAPEVCPTISSLFKNSKESSKTILSTAEPKIPFSDRM